MKKTYKIEVDCANCANLMEAAANKTDGVECATVNFMTQKMIVAFQDGREPAAVMKEVLKLSLIHIFRIAVICMEMIYKFIYNTEKQGPKSHYIPDRP